MLFLIVALSLLTQCEEKGEPISPPATQLGEQPSFDKILQNAEDRWEFVFTTDTQIVITDIYGKKEHFILDTTTEAKMLDTTTEAKKSQARFLWNASISPDSRYFLSPFYYERSLAQDRPDSKFVLVELTTRANQIFTPQYKDFQLGWPSPSYWLSPTVFLVRINKFTKQQGYYSSETVKILRYEVDNLDAPKVINLVSDDPVMCWKPQPPTLLLANEDEPAGMWEEVNVIDISGVRDATPQEIDYFNNNCYKVQSAISPVDIRLKKIITATEPLRETEYWKNNWNRYHILLADNIVRCSDGAINRVPVWDPELQLFIWYEEVGEEYPVYYMDIKGHYRLWYKGNYWGKIPKQ